MTAGADHAGRVADRAYRQQAKASGGSVVIQAIGDLHIHVPAADLASWRPAQDAAEAECPYPGLDAFGPEQARWFFGRDRLTGELIELLDEWLRTDGGGPVIAVGSSGAGKSSLLRAGLVSAIAAGRLPAAGSAGWPALVFSVGATPMATLAALISERAGSEIGEATPQELASALRGVPPAGAGTRPAERTLIVADQLEELFTACADEEERLRFVQTLAEITARDSHRGPAGLVVLGLRADFYARAAAYPLLRQSLQHRQIVVGPMTPAEIRDAITGPARVAGLHLEDGLPDLLIRDLGAGPAAPDGAGYEAGRLPLLAHALRASWQRREGTRLTIAGYEATGGIAGALAQTAERAFGKLDDAGQQAARLIFLRLVQIGEGGGEPGSEGAADTLRRVRRDSLLAAVRDQAAAKVVLGKFVAVRLLTVSAGDTVQITHEALLRRWPRLSGWIGRDRAGQVIHQDLEDAAASWEREHRDPGMLYSGNRLETVRSWAADAAHGAELGRLAQAFLAASARRQRRRARQRNGIIAALAMLSLGLATLAGVAFHLRGTAQAAAGTAHGEALAGQAANELSRGDPRAAMMTAVQAYRQAPASPQALGELLSMQSQEYLDRFFAGTAGGDSVAFSSDGRTIATADDDGSIRLYDMATRHQLALIKEPDSIDGIAFSPHGALLAAAYSSNNGSVVMLWNATTRSRPVPVHIMRASAGLEADTVAFSRDGTRVAVGDSRGTVWVWDTGSGRLIGTSAAGGTWISSLTFSADDYQLVAADLKGTWLVQLGHQPVPLYDGGQAVAISPDGRRLLAEQDDAGSVTYGVELSALSGPPIDSSYYVQNGPTSYIPSVAFSPDGLLMAAGCENGKVYVWDVATGQLVDTLSGYNLQVTDIAFAPRSDVLASAGNDGTVILWNLADDVINDANAVALAPGGRLLAVGAYPGWESQPQVTLYALPSRRQVRTLVSPQQGGDGIGSIAFSPDGQLLAATVLDATSGTGSAKQAITLETDVWDLRLATQRPILQIPPQPQLDGTTEEIAFSFPSGRLLARAQADSGTTPIWDTSRRKQVEKTWYTGNLAVPYSPASEGVQALAVAPTNLLAIAYSNGAIGLWNLAREQSGGNGYSLPANVAATAVAFSHDGRILAVGGSDGDIYLFDVRTGQKSGPPLAQATQQITQLAFSSNDHTLVSASADGYMDVWDVPARTLTEAIQVNSGGSFVMAYDAASGTLATVNGAVVRLWNTSPQQVAARICQQLGYPASCS